MTNPEKVDAPPPIQQPTNYRSAWAARLRSADIGQWYRFAKGTPAQAAAARSNVLERAKTLGINVEATCRGADLYYRVISRPENADGQS